MGWQWHQLDHMQIICTCLLLTDNHARPSSLIFLQAECAGCSSWCPANNVKSLKANVKAPAFTPISVYTTWWKRHMGVNNLPKVVTQPRCGRESNSRPLDYQATLKTIRNNIIYLKKDVHPHLSGQSFSMKTGLWIMWNWCPAHCRCLCCP